MSKSISSNSFGGDCSWFYTCCRSGSPSSGCRTGRYQGPSVPSYADHPQQVDALYRQGWYKPAAPSTACMASTATNDGRKTLSGVGEWWYSRAGGGGYQSCRQSRSSSFPLAPTLNRAADTHLWSCFGSVSGHKSGSAAGPSG